MEKAQIILVDDEPEILEIFQKLLLSEGYHVRCAQDGSAALAMMTERPAEVVVTDIRMPGMDGFEVLRTVKSMDDLVEVIVLTGHASIEAAVSSMKNDGAFDFLTKPIDNLDDFLIVIEKALKHRRLRMENASLLEALQHKQEVLEAHNKDLRRTKQHLEASRRRYQDLYDHAPVGYLTIDTHGTIQDVNQTAAVLLGLNKDQLRGETFESFVTRDGLSAYHACRSAMNDTTHHSCEMPMRRAGGGTIHALIEAMVIMGSGGQPQQIRVTLSDRTAQKKIESALGESEQRYRTLVETIPHGIQEVDIQGTITFANAGHAAIHGYEVDDLIGRSLADLACSAEEGQEVLDSLRQLAATQPGPEPWVGCDCTRDGVHKDIQVDWDYKRDAHGQVVGFVSILSDITERKKAETALLESEARYRSFIENFKGIAFRLNVDGTPVFFHGAVADLTGYGEDQLVSQVGGWEKLIHPEEATLVASRRKSLSIGGERSLSQEYRIRHRNGQWRWVREHIQNICAENETPTGFQGVLFDITEHKQLQVQYFQSRKLEAIATLAGGVAHQFNNTLAGLMGNLELLEMDMKPDDPANKYTAVMKVLGQKMSTLTQQLLGYARGGKYASSEIALGDLARHSMELIRHRLEPNIQLEIDLCNGHDWVRVDTAQLQMVLLAIMDNAVESMPDGGRVCVRTRDVIFTAEQVMDYPDRPPGQYICLSIQDNGCGMDLETEAKIFDPFFTTKFIGRGLGLSAAYGIVANHNGWISVSSTPGTGTTIHLYLPVVVQKKTAVGNDESGQRAPEGGATVLVVEDEQMVMEAVSELLERLDYRVLQAATGHRALEILRTFNGLIDVVLLDVRLPDLEADTVYARIQEIRPGTQVVVCSGYDKEGPVEALLEAGAQGFLQKPFSSRRLSAKLKAVLRSDSNPHRPGNPKRGRHHLRLI